MNLTMNKYIYLFGGIVFIIGGIRILKLQVFEFRYYPPLELGNYSIIIGLIFIVIGIFFLYSVYEKKEQKQKYKICPNCKATFTSNELKDGKCKYCKDIDTIDTSQYYKEHPEELES